MIRITALLVGVFVGNSLFGQLNHDSLKNKLNKTIRKFDGTVGIAVIGIESGDTLTVHDSIHYPMQSVFKFPLALAVLAQVDNKQLDFNRKIHVTKADLQPDTWSPLRDSFPEGEIDLTISELLYYSVSMSDNNACDILFKVAGGPLVVSQYIHELGIGDVEIAATEYDMTKSWDVQFTNWSTPFAMAVMLKDFQQHKYLSDEMTALLLKLMTESSNSDKRIKGSLDKSVVVAHKTGTSGTNDTGVLAAANDVGIITLPNGNHVALVVFVSNTTEKMKDCEALIARVAKLVYAEMK